MQLLSTILNTRFWLMAMGAFLVLFTGFALVSGQAASSASNFWTGELTERELNIAIVVEVVWFAHMLGMGAIIFFLGLLAANPARARIGAIATPVPLCRLWCISWSVDLIYPNSVFNLLFS